MDPIYGLTNLNADVDAQCTAVIAAWTVIHAQNVNAKLAQAQNQTNDLDWILFLDRMAKYAEENNIKGD